MRKKLQYLLICILAITCVNISTFAQLQVAIENDPNAIIETLLGEGVMVSNVQLNCIEDGAGIFDGSNSNIGLNNGIILSTGYASDAIGPNDSSGGDPNGTNTQPAPNSTTVGDPDLEAVIGLDTNDPCILEFDFVPFASAFEFNYVFASEEYLEFVNTGFNDGFAFFISGPGFNGLENIALLPGTNTPVTIDNVNSTSNSQYFINNGDGENNIDPNSTIQYDGFTTVLKAIVNVTPCETYHLKMVIADIADTFWDSGVFIEANSISTDFALGDPIHNCNPDGSYDLEIPLLNPGSGTTFTVTENNAALGINDVTFVDDGSNNSINIGTYPLGAGFNVSFLACGSDEAANLSGPAVCVQDFCPNAPEPGATCDDGDACTTGDIVGDDCNCTGVFQDADDDGVCDNDDVCPNFDDNLIGTACDDGDACTINDVYGNDCNCAGTFADDDNDGVCDNDDVCPNFDDNLIGTACDDGDACTINDTYGEDCDCAGTFVDIDNDGVCNNDDVCPNFDDNLIGTACDDGEDCTINDVYGNDCNCAGTNADADNDGVCDSDDVCPNFDDNLIGTACDDGDVCTINDIYGNDCNCAGTYVDSDDDGVCDGEDVCPNFDDSLIGTACDDGDACTINDVYGNDCNCAGTFEDSDGDGICDNDDSCPLLDNALIGTPCDDENPDTEMDTYTVDCMCIGMPICMGMLESLGLERNGALCAANTEVPQDGTEIYNWFNENDEQVAQFTGNPYFSPSELGTYYVIVTHPGYDCYQSLGPRTIDSLDGCCELEEEGEGN